MKQASLVVIALIAGFAGGFVASITIRAHEKSTPPELIQARSFELVNSLGRVTSYWGIDKTNNTVLAFSAEESGPVSTGTDSERPSDPSSQKIALGSTPSGTGFLALRGKDSKTRVRIYLSEFDKPYLFLEDETGPRISLGHQQSDTPAPGDDDWALNFHPERASIGMVTRRDESGRYVKGFIAVNQDKLKVH